MEGGAPLSAFAWPTDAVGRDWLTPVREAIILDIVDAPVLAQKAAQALHSTVGMSFTGVAIREESGLFAMRGVAGGRHDPILRQIKLSAGQGVGGKVVALRSPVLVSDYVNDPAITTHFRDLAILESFGGMAAVPVIAEGDIVAILYTALRDSSTLGDDAVTRLAQAAAGLSDLFGVAIRHQDSVRRQAAAERLRIAEDLHDTVGQMLFAIGTSARRLRLEAEGASPLGQMNLPNLARLGESIEGDAARATGMLRHALGRLTPRDPEESLPLSVRVGVEEFSRSSDVTAHLVVIGEPRTVTADAAGALLAVVREGLHNVAKHADATLVIVTLAYSADRVEIVVQDDGRGLPARFTLQALPADPAGGGFGLPSLLRRMQQLGGTLEVRRAPQRGTALRAALPLDRDGTPPA